MILHLRLPDQCAGDRVHGVGIGAQIAKKHGKLVGTGDRGKTDRGSNDRLRFERPAGASGFCVKRVDLAITAPHKQQAADNGWLGHCGRSAREIRTPISAATMALGLASIRPSLSAETGYCQDPPPSHSIAAHPAAGETRPNLAHTRKCRSRQPARSREQPAARAPRAAKLRCRQLIAMKSSPAHRSVPLLGITTA